MHFSPNRLPNARALKQLMLPNKYFGLLCCPEL
jgi:hypothetical protein